MSSLAAQFAKNASLNSALLVDRTRRKPAASYLFTGRDADQHDLETIHALGQNALIQLSSIAPALQHYEDILFSEQAKTLDRTLLTDEVNDELDKSIHDFLVLLGPYLMEAPTGKVLEWLVRRFRINEFNIDAIMTLFLPYHETPHFTKMVTILHIKPNSLWTFLKPYKSAAQNIPRVSLVSEMLRNSDFSRFVIFLLPTAVREGRAYRVLLAFNAATIHEFIKRSKTLDEGTVAYVLPALLEPLQQKSANPSKDSILGSYVLLAGLSQKCELAPTALKIIVGSMASSASHVSAKQFISAAVAICQPQSELEKISESTLKAILGLEGISEELCSACDWYGSENFLLPMVKGLSTRLTDGSAATLLENITANTSVPDVILDRLTALLMTALVSSETALAERRLLSFMQQRHPSVVQRVAKELSEEDDESKTTIEQLIMSLSMTSTIDSSLQSSGNADLVIASTHADSNIRAIAVRNLVSSLNGFSTESDDLIPLQSVLLARVSDNSPDVLKSVYGQPEIVAPIFSSRAKEYIDVLSGAIASTSVKPKRSILRIHLAFLASHMIKTSDSSVQEDIFDRIFFPFLLFSKPRQHTAELMWDIVSQNLQVSIVSPAFELLRGCGELVQIGKASDNTMDMVASNMVISSRIAENILQSNKFPQHLAALTTKLQDSNPHSRVLSYLIMRSLVGKLSGAHQIEAAHEVLELMKLDRVEGVDDIPEGRDLIEIISEGSVERNVVVKPNSKVTLRWLQISILVTILKIEQPTNGLLNWMTDPGQVLTSIHDFYLHSMQTIYRLATVSTTVPVLSMGLLQVLFLSLKDDALAFLGGIWMSTRSEMEPFRRIALLHGAAFLEAHVLEKGGLDFQTILPSLLIVLQSRDAQTRRAAFECITRLRIIADGQLSQVYKFDVIYGQKNHVENLQYLDQEDLKRYLGTIVEYRDHFENDSSYLPIFHGHYLVKASGEKKREAEYKRRVLCYLLSHVNALSLQDNQAKLLNSIHAISIKAKLQLLLPTIQSLLSATNLSDNDLTKGLVSCFNASAAKDLNDQGQPYWKVYIALIRKCFDLRASTPLQDILSEGLEGNLWAKLNQDRQIELANLFLEIGSQDTDSSKVCRQILAKLLDDVQILAYLLDSLSPAPNDSGQRASKRAKTTEISNHPTAQLTFLVEILGTKSLLGSIELITRLLETLNRIVQSHTSFQVDVNYIEQLLMSAVDNAANKVLEIPNISPTAIRLDVLVELIRITDNPQTFHQALLLMASLARLAPESVLHNVMPVFTFMGSNVFHRDDSYSFKVVQQTIDSIVPVMVNSLKTEHPDRLQLHIGAKEFLRVFTDASNHIPRHRRNNFFAHFVNVLGPDDFLAPVCMLLIEKIATRLVRQTEDEIETSFALPMSVLQSTSMPTQIQTITEILNECHRLATRLIDPDDAQPIFLQFQSDGENTASMILKRRAQALALFVGYGLNSPFPSVENISLGSAVSKLISLAMLHNGNVLESNVEDISRAARQSLNRLLGVMSAKDFVHSVSSMLDSGNVQVQAGALELLAQRLHNLSPQYRQEATPTIIKILSSIKFIVTEQRQGTVTIFALQALKSIALTTCADEENSLAELVPHLLDTVEKPDIDNDAWNALLAISTSLGPRIIPHFRAIIGQCITTLRKGNSSSSTIFLTLQGLLSSIPTFWAAPEVSSVANFYMEQGASRTSPMASLIKTLTKRVPAKILLPALLDVWTHSQNINSRTGIAAYFELLSKALRSADRPSVLEHLRALFKVFMDALSTTARGLETEDYIISAFKELVVKLNETAFRPLFRRLYDWAFAADDHTDHQIVFVDLYIALQDYFKGLMSPYMTFLLSPYNEIMKSYSLSSRDNPVLWESVVVSLTKSLIHDDTGFWRDDKLRQISSTLIGQVDVVIKLNHTDGRQLLQECIAALVEAVTDDTLLKTINLDILMHTRSEDVKLRVYALNCSGSLWRTHGGKLLGFVAETTTFIAECSEDENDMVVKESFRLKDAVESIAGKIDGL